MKYLVLIITLSFLSCTIEEDYPDQVRIVGEWGNTGRTAVLKNGDVFESWFLGDCETRTNYIFYENGNLFVDDYIDSGIQDGGTDFCIQNEETSKNGNWEILSTGKFRLILKNEKDSTKFEIEPYAIEFIEKNRLDIRYKEFEEIDQDSVAYLVYHFFRVYNTGTN